MSCARGACVDIPVESFTLEIKKGNYNRATVQPPFFDSSVSAFESASCTAPILPWLLKGVSLTGKRAHIESQIQNQV